MGWVLPSRCSPATCRLCVQAAGGPGRLTLATGAGAKAAAAAAGCAREHALGQPSRSSSQYVQCTQLTDAGRVNDHSNRPAE
jgi:hypothetical protein